MAGFFGEELRGRVFEDMEKAFRHIQVQALKAGFEIGCSQSFESVSAQFYCLKGGRKKGEKSKKEGCPWVIKMGTAREHGRGYVKVTDFCFDHNHECQPDFYSVFTCGEREQDLIVKMRQCSVEPRKIIDVMHMLGVEGVTARQIQGDRRM